MNRDRIIVWSAVAGVAVLAIGGLGLAAWNSTASAGATPTGRLLNIAVVAPVEPEVQPGGVMPVGELVEGYEHDPAILTALHGDPFDDVHVETAWIEPEPALPAPVTGMAVVRTDAPQPGIEPIRLDPRDRSYGFSQPQPDYAAQRADRQARMEAIEARQAAEPPAFTSDASGAGELKRDSIFF